MLPVLTLHDGMNLFVCLRVSAKIPKPSITPSKAYLEMYLIATYLLKEGAREGTFLISCFDFFWGNLALVLTQSHLEYDI